ncbi:MAG: hypothetical protein M1825_001072 [Sarcosagium campestre]|nr:MAG: hypothetical protein M1825_001072 [Sarcosagium campestre]
MSKRQSHARRRMNARNRSPAETFQATAASDEVVVASNSEGEPTLTGSGRPSPISSSSGASIESNYRGVDNMTSIKRNALRTIPELADFEDNSTRSRRRASQFTTMAEHTSPIVADTADDRHGQTELASPSHTFSLTWLSPNEREFQNFTNTRQRLARFAPQSEFVPQTFQDWLDHRIRSANDESNAGARRLANLRAQQGRPVVMGAFGNKTFTGNRGWTLSEETIWCPGQSTGRKVANWPSLQEMKWEGDDRARTNVRRFPPIPREPGNETVAWHQLQALRPYSFDEVRKVPTREDTMSNAEDDEPIPSTLINSDLWAAIDE